MNLASSLSQCLINRLVQSTLDQQVRTLRINADTGKIGPVSNAAQPSMKFRKVEIGAKEAGYDDDRGAIAMRHAQAVVHGCCVQDEYLSPKQCLGPKRGIGWGIATRSRRTPLRGGRTRCCFLLFTRQVRPWFCRTSASRQRWRMLHCNNTAFSSPQPNTFSTAADLDVAVIDSCEGDSACALAFATGPRVPPPAYAGSQLPTHLQLAETMLG